MNKELNIYEAADIKGRELFKEFCNTQSWCKMITVAPLDKVWDVAYYSGGTKVIGEIKVRDYNSKAFIDWDYEHKKHHNLLDIYNQTKSKKRNQNKKIEIQYINFFTDDAIKIWTTTNLHNEQQPKLKNRNISKVQDRGNKDKLIYGCDLKIEAFRGSIIPFLYEENNDYQDNLPF